MSWSCSCTIPKGTSDDDAQAIVQAMKPAGDDDAAAERDRACEYAKGAALSIIEFGSIEGGVLGNANEHGWRVTLSGHANKDNAPQAVGSGRDFVQVAITQTE